MLNSRSVVKKSVMRVPLAGLVVGLFCAACSQQTPEQKFSEAYARSLRANLPGYSAEIVGGLEIRVIRPEGGEPVTAYLDNAFREWNASGGDQEALFARYRTALAVRTQDEKLELTAEQVLPVIKNREYVDNLVKMSDGDASDVPFHEALNEELFVFYVQDTSESMRYLHEADLASVQFTPETRREKSLQNLQGHLTDVAFRGGNGFFMLTADGTYEASLLLSDKIWMNEALVVKGDIVVAAVARDLVVITGSEDGENLARVRKIVAETEATGSYLVSPRLFVRRDGRWMLFEYARDN